MALIKNNPDVNKTIDELMLNDFGTLTSTLTKRFGPEYIDRVENLVTQSFNNAKTQWSYSNIPNNPKNTIWQFITDNTADLFCHKVNNYKYQYTSNNKSTTVQNLNYPDNSEAIENKIIMLFTCCGPNLSEDQRILLIMKILGGYTTSFIARTLSKNQSSVTDEIKEAKYKIWTFRD